MNDLNEIMNGCMCDEWMPLSSVPRPWASLGGEMGRYLLQVVKLHCDLPEEEVDVAAPLHRMHKVGLYGRGGVSTQPLT